MKRKRSTGNKKLSLISSLLAVIIAVAMMIFIPEMTHEDIKDESLGYLDYPFCVTFFDVGQGDASLISCDGYYILVDGGEVEYSSTIINFLESNGIKKLDAYVLTHPHSDHIGAAADIINSVECDKIFTTYFSEFNVPTTNVYERVLDAIYESGAEPVAVEAGDSFRFGDLEIDIVAPIFESEEYNAMSVVFTAQYKGSSVLFTGDTIKNVENQMLDYGYNVDADVLKVAHHGSTTSNSEAFIEAVSPELAVISCGAGNSYGHPHDEIVQMFDEMEIEYIRTDYAGDIYYFGDGNTMYLETEK